MGSCRSTASIGTAKTTACSATKNLGSDRADFWLGQFADDFNSIAKWVQVTANDYMDTYAYVWVDPGLDRDAGEAPYTAAAWVTTRHGLPGRN
jgi:hypothetical protein